MKKTLSFKSKYQQEHNYQFKKKNKIFQLALGFTNTKTVKEATLVLARLHF